MQKNNLKHFIHLHFLVFIAGFTAILGELIVNSSEVIVWHRMFIGSILLAMFMFFSKRSFKINLKLLLQYSFLGLIIALHWITFFEAIEQSNISVTLAMFSTAAFFTSFIEPFLFKRKVIFYEVILGFVVVCGVYLIFNAESNKEVGTTDTVKALILSRLKASEDYKSIIKTSLFFMSQPRNAYDAFNQVMKTSNKIWEIAGDTSNGGTFYSKRLILSGVYSSTLAHWVAKEIRSIEESENFLDRRLDDVKKIGKISKQSIDAFEKTKRELGSIITRKYR